VTTGDSTPQPLRPAPWDWASVEGVLVVRLRSIGDAVLATPALHALRRFLPRARIDLLVEDWLAPLFEAQRDASRIVTVAPDSLGARVRAVRELRAGRYDVAFDLHGGTTATLLAFASGALRRVGYARYQLSRLLSHRAPAASELWRREGLHSVEEQLALLGFAGVPVSDRPRTRLTATHVAQAQVRGRLEAAGLDPRGRIALLHPAAAFESKRWSTDGFARVAEHLHERGFAPVAIAARHEAGILSALKQLARVSVTVFSDLALSEVLALAAASRVFVGNDSGIAHVAAAVRTPQVVVFGSSNVTHWRPWTDAPAEVVRRELPCAPCPGYTCDQADRFGCIRGIPAEAVLAAVDRVLAAAAAAPRETADV
jgi:lipopolysaccharide heptosyltransferase II